MKEGRLHQLRFADRLEQLGEELSLLPAEAFRFFDSVPGGGREQRLLRREVFRGDRSAGVVASELHDRLAHRQTAEGRSPVDDLVAPRSLRASRDRRGETREHLLGEPHQVFAFRVRLVELEHRELGIVVGRDALVAEVAVDLVHLRHAADHQPLQVELGRDPQKEVDVERVVVGHEGPRHGAARQGLHHRRLDFEIPALVQKAPEKPDDRRPPLEHLTGLRIDGEVQVALAIAALHVLQAVPLFRERMEGLGQERQSPGLDRAVLRSGS